MTKRHPDNGKEFLTHHPDCCRHDHYERLHLSQMTHIPLHPALDARRHLTRTANHIRNQARSIFNPRKYLYNIAIALDETLNAILTGDPSETISSRLGKLRARYHGTIPWKYWYARILAATLDAIDPGHCDDSIDPHTGHNNSFDHRR